MVTCAAIMALADTDHDGKIALAELYHLGELLQGNEQLKAELFEPPAGGHAISEAEKAEEAAKSELREKEQAAKHARLKKLEQARLIVKEAAARRRQEHATLARQAMGPCVTEGCTNNGNGKPLAPGGKVIFMPPPPVFLVWRITDGTYRGK